MLDFGGMLKAAIDDGTETFGLENEVLESGGVDAYVVTPDLSSFVWVEKEKEINSSDSNANHHASLILEGWEICDVCQRDDFGAIKNEMNSNHHDETGRGGPADKNERQVFIW